MRSDQGEFEPNQHNSSQAAVSLAYLRNKRRIQRSFPSPREKYPATKKNFKDFSMANKMCLQGFLQPGELVKARGEPQMCRKKKQEERKGKRKEDN